MSVKETTTDCSSKVDSFFICRRALCLYKLARMLGEKCVQDNGFVLSRQLLYPFGGEARFTNLFGIKKLDLV